MSTEHVAIEMPADGSVALRLRLWRLVVSWTADADRNGYGWHIRWTQR